MDPWGDDGVSLRARGAGKGKYRTQIAIVAPLAISGLLLQRRLFGLLDEARRMRSVEIHAAASIT